jgi:hypothetical protein
MAIKFTDIDIAALALNMPKGKGGASKRFGQVTLNKGTKEKLSFQLPGCRLCFDLNEYNSLSLSVKDPIFVQFLEEFEQWLLTELFDAPNIDMGLKVHPDGKFDPTFRLKVTDETGYYGTDKVRTDKSILKRGTELHVLAQLNCVYNIDNKWGVSWKALQVRKGELREGSPAQSPKSEMEFLDD